MVVMAWNIWKTVAGQRPFDASIPSVQLGVHPAVRPAQA
jgi:hypothetical protein